MKASLLGGCFGFEGRGLCVVFLCAAAPRDRWDEAHHDLGGFAKRRGGHLALSAHGSLWQGEREEGGREGGQSFAVVKQKSEQKSADVATTSALKESEWFCAPTSPHPGRFEKTLAPGRDRTATFAMVSTLPR